MPVEQLADLEILIGSVLTLDANQIWSSLIDPEKIALETHNPTWWVSYCYRLLGRSEGVKLLSAASRPRYIRINPLKNHGRTTLPSRAKPLETALAKVAHSLPVYAVQGSLSTFSEFFSEGIFQIQDLASFLAVKAADPAPGEDVLDICAAPGGKTAALAQLMKNQGRIVSVDYSTGRMRSWRREITRLGVKIAEPVICSVSDMAVTGTFDLIVIDPPCTGSGILDRHPSMKWHLTPESTERYSRLQQHFLNSSSRLLAPDGRILYCTCSLTVEENEYVVSEFLKSHPDFETRPVLREYGSPGLEGFTDCRRLWPHRDRTAGYFIARLQRLN
jgi:16S rRNA (cytosine967-C5)-methyltransferase